MPLATQASLSPRRALASGLLLCLLLASRSMAQGSSATRSNADTSRLTRAASSVAPQPPRTPPSAEYTAVQDRLAQGWNTWDVHSVTTHVLLPAGLAVHIGLQHNATEGGDAFLPDTLIGRLTPGAEKVFPGPHAWDGSYTELRVSWKGHDWKVQSARDSNDLVLLVTPLPTQATSTLPPTIIFSVDYLWDHPGTVQKEAGVIHARTSSHDIPIYCTCTDPAPNSPQKALNVPVGGTYYATDLLLPVALSTGRPRTLSAVQAILDRQQRAYQQSLSRSTDKQPIIDAIETTLGWDTIFEPSAQRVVSPVSRVWSVNWGGYVIFDWDTFFAATMAGIGDRDLAYADALETLRESTAEGFVPNYARAGNWKSSDRSEPPVGAITVLGLYREFGDTWFLRDAFPPLLQWNRWWAQHRDIDGYLTWGSDGDNQPANLDDSSVGTRLGAILESGLDNSPMYDSAVFNQKTHLLEYADVGLMSMYVADCDALAAIAEVLHRTDEAKELRTRGAHYRSKLQTMWSPESGIFLNRDLHTGEVNHRLSPTNFYPMLAHAATDQQVQRMIHEHLLNPQEFWGEWILPSIARNDPAFHDQDYWRGRIWGPMNYLVYLGLRNYNDPDVRAEFARKSLDLFLKEWRDQGHVHENYNAVQGTGDDVSNSDRFYHWGALLGFMEYLEQKGSSDPADSTTKTRGPLTPGK